MTEKINPDEKSVPFWPDHLMYEAKVALWFGVALVLLGVLVIAIRTEVPAAV